MTRLSARAEYFDSAELVYVAHNTAHEGASAPRAVEYLLEDTTIVTGPGSSRKRTTYLLEEGVSIDTFPTHQRRSLTLYQKQAPTAKMMSLL